MGKAQKLLDRWSENVPREARLQDVETFLNTYFHGMWDQRGTSHIVVRCTALKDFPDYKPNGEISVLVKSGQKVKGFYIRQLIKAVYLLAKSRGDTS